MTSAQRSSPWRSQLYLPPRSAPVLCFGGKQERPVADERETLVLKIADLKADLKALTELVGFMDEDGEAARA